MSCQPIEGDCRLIEGDCLEVLRTMPSGSVDAVVTDPPYSSGGQFRGDRIASTTAKYVQSGTKIHRPEFSGDNRDQRAYGYWCALWLSECLRIARPGSPICVFTDWRQLPTTTDAIQAGGWVWRGVAAWDKTEEARPQKGRFRAQCEYVVWGSKGAMPPRDGVDVLPGVFRAISPRDKRHIAEKPLSVMETIVRICPAGGTVLDPFAGSGSTGEACLRTGRRFIGVECDSAGAALARARLECLSLVEAP